MRDVDVDAEIHRRLDFHLHRLSLQLADRLFQEFRVHLEADRCDLSGLLAAQNVSCAADLQILRRDAEAGAEVGELLDGGEAFARVARQNAIARHQQITERQPVTAADAPAELVKLRKAETLRMVDEDRVARWNVDAILDDRRGKQHVILAVDEGEHRPLQLPLLHLSVPDDDAHSGHQLLEILLRGVDRLHAVVDEEDLAAAADLELDGLADEVVCKWDDGGLDGQAILRRRLDHRDVSDADHRHVQGARNRRRGHRQDVDGFLHLLQSLLLSYAEALLFVDDQQAEVLERDVFRKNPMRADDDVDLAMLELADDLLLFLRRVVARQQLDRHRKRGEASKERTVVLIGQDGRRREHGHLLAVHHRLERRPHRHLGFSVADVATEQTVHRLARLHVALHLVDCHGLVFGLVEFERFLELELPR